MRNNIVMYNYNSVVINDAVCLFLFYSFVREPREKSFLRCGSLQLKSGISKILAVGGRFESKSSRPRR